MPGNRPSSLLLYPRLSAEVLGALIAAYEHKTFFESQIWGINPFDQWGVELGKQISQAVYPALQGDSASLPVDLQASLHHIASLRKPS
jgi:glucose-6-phosphate isomerase